MLISSKALVGPQRDKTCSVHVFLYEDVPDEITRDAMSKKVNGLLAFFEEHPNLPPEEILFRTFLIGSWRRKQTDARSVSEGNSYDPWCKGDDPGELRWRFDTDGTLAEQCGNREICIKHYDISAAEQLLYTELSSSDSENHTPGTSQKTEKEVYHFEFFGRNLLRLYDLDGGKRTPENCTCRFDMERTKYE